jgi:hypothetical protein
MVSPAEWLAGGVGGATAVRVINGSEERYVSGYFLEYSQASHAKGMHILDKQCAHYLQS